jgi:hypothetical protein
MGKHIRWRAASRQLINGHGTRTRTRVDSQAACRRREGTVGVLLMETSVERSTKHLQHIARRASYVHKIPAKLTLVRTYRYENKQDIRKQGKSTTYNPKSVFPKSATLAAPTAVCAKLINWIVSCSLLIPPATSESAVFLIVIFGSGPSPHSPFVKT